MNATLLPPYSAQTPTPSEFTGYPETMAAAQHWLESKKEVNASCPGESSASFLDITAPDNGCNQPHYQPPAPTIPPFKTTYGLHTNYSGSQMAFAEAQLRANKHIDLVTLSLGANDVLLALPAIQNCTDTACVQSVLAPVLQSYAINLTEILGRIRAAYQGTLVLMTYYSPSPALDGITQALNGTMMQVASQPGFAPIGFADGFTAFQQASAAFNHDACQAGLLVRLPPSPYTTSPCDVHPSPLGRDILATTVMAAMGNRR